MKKLFINCPVEHRKKEDVEKSIEKIHAIAEIEFGEKLEVIRLPDKTYVDDNKGRLEHLRNLIDCLITADYIATSHFDRELWWANSELNNIIGSLTIRRNNKNVMYIDTTHLMPDIDGIHKHRHGYVDDEF